MDEHLSDPKHLILALRHESPGVKTKAAIALGDIAEPLAVEPLISSFKEHENESRRYRARYAYGGDRELHSTWGKAVITALGQIGGARATEFLIETLNYEDEKDARGRRKEDLNLCAMDALRRIGYDAVEPLLALLEKGGDCRMGAWLEYAAKTLLRIDEKLAIERFVDLINDPHITTTARIKMIDLVLQSGEIPIKRPIETLLIARLHNRDSAESLLDKFDPDWAKADEARTIVPWLLMGLKEDNFRQAAIHLSGRIGDARAFGALMELTDHSEIAAQILASIERILERSASEIPEQSLSAAAHLDNVTQRRLYYHSTTEGSYDSAWSVAEDSDADCSRIRQLACDELLRRRHN